MIEGSAEKEIEEIGAPNGTTIIIRELFYNTPARKKFLKSAQTEGAYISDIMERLALSRPDISVKFINNGQTRFHTSGKNDLKEIIYKIYGREQAMSLLQVNYEKNDISISGFIGKPETTRANRSNEIFFVNGRNIKSNLMSTALEDGYKSFLMQHRFPFAVLNLVVSPENMDINIHPSKMEVKFSDENLIMTCIVDSIRNCFINQELIKSVELLEQNNKKTENENIKSPEPFEIKRKELLENISVKENIPCVKEEPDYKILGSTTNNQEFTTSDKFSNNIIKSHQQIIVEKPVQMNLFEEHFLSKDKMDDYHILGQIFKTYWLIESGDKLYFMDQHAAHEKVMFEHFLNNLKENSITRQSLNPPVVLQLTQLEEVIMKEYMEIFNKMGFVIDEFGPSAYAIREVPSDLYGLSEKEYFEEVLDSLEQKGTKNINNENINHIYDKIASMACKAAVKGNNELDLEEAKVLLKELMELDNPYNCPHGRPTLFSMSRYEIEKKFSRIV